MNTNTTIELLKKTVFSICSVQSGYKKKKTGATNQQSSAQTAVTRGPEHVKLKNLYYYKALPVSGW
jgi:hypothetical protein